jgi:hypothetical protein
VLTRCCKNSASSSCNYFYLLAHPALQDCRMIYTCADGICYRYGSWGCWQPHPTTSSQALVLFRVGAVGLGPHFPLSVFRSRILCPNRPTPNARLRGARLASETITSLPTIEPIMRRARSEPEATSTLKNSWMSHFKLGFHALISRLRKATRTVGRRISNRKKRGPPNPGQSRAREPP